MATPSQTLDLHDELRAAFYKPVGANVYDRHFQFNAQAHRRFIDTNARKLSGRLSALVAMAIEETLSGAVVARFDDWILCTGKKPKAVPTIERIERKLLRTFPGASFNIDVAP